MKVLILLSKLLDRVFYGGYRAELDSATDDIVARYSRGSIALQLKHFVMQDDVEALHKEGDKAAKRLGILGQGPRVADGLVVDARPDAGFVGDRRAILQECQGIAEAAAKPPGGL